MKAVMLVCLLSFLVIPVSVQAQVSSEGQVSASGTAEIKHAADILRVQVELTGKGKDLKEALSKLNEKKELATAQLVNLGAAKSDVMIAEPNVANERNDRQRQIEMMMMQRRGAKKADPKNKQPEPLVVTAMLKADVPLKAGSPEELLQKGHTLQEKIKAADLGGLKETDKLSPKEEELAEEMQEMNRMMGETGEMRRGEPSFVFVYKISSAEHDKALKDAFAKAGAQARKLANAAGVELGNLHTLQSVALPGAADYMTDYYGRASRMMMRDADGDQTEKDDTQEAVGMNPTKVIFKVSVSVSFLIKSKK